MWNWIDILSDGEPDKERLSRRLMTAFLLFLVSAFVGIIAHGAWAIQSGDGTNFARGGAWLIGISIALFGYNQHLLILERWRYQHKIEREGLERGAYFLDRHYLEWNMRFFNAANIGFALLGAVISGYGDLLIEAALK
tara:strand:+ start:1526 stop:1939 length:414 start_codon:yes stop_codon:yes gene_type:complete